MKNLFNFEYQTKQIQNLDGSESRFAIVYGEGGQVTHAKKDSYSIVRTQDVSNIGTVLIDKGYGVNTFTHKNGEFLGLDVTLGEHQSKVGDKKLNAILYVPNNGSGAGTLYIHENRIICSNGLIISSKKQLMYKVPHSKDYKHYLKTAGEIIEGANKLVQLQVERDQYLDSQKIDEVELLKILNEWFFNFEIPTSQKGELTLNKFRELLVVAPDELKCINRYNEMKTALQRELQYNTDLNLNLSKYTALATITNYLSRRREKSKSEASKCVQQVRTLSKVKDLVNIL